MTKKEPKKKQADNRDSKGRFVKGKSGNPEHIGVGRPKGSISITEQIKRKLKEIPRNQKKTYLEMLITKIMKKAIKEEDQQMIKQIWNYIDGMPKQSLELGVDEAISEVNISIKKNEDSKSTGDNSVPKGLGGISEKGNANPDSGGGNRVKQDSVPIPTDGNDNAEGEGQADNDSPKVPASPESDSNEGLPPYLEGIGGV